MEALNFANVFDILQEQFKEAVERETYCSF